MENVENPIKAKLNAFPITMPCQLKASGYHIAKIRK